MICGEHRIAVGFAINITHAEWSVGVVAVQLSFLIAVASIHRRSIVVTRTSGCTRNMNFPRLMLTCILRTHHHTNNNSRSNEGNSKKKKIEYNRRVQLLQSDTRRIESKTNKKHRLCRTNEIKCVQNKCRSVRFHVCARSSLHER